MNLLVESKAKSKHEYSEPSIFTHEVESYDGALMITGLKVRIAVDLHQWLVIVVAQLAHFVVQPTVKKILSFVSKQLLQIKPTRTQLLLYNLSAKEFRYWSTNITSTSGSNFPWREKRNDPVKIWLRAFRSALYVKTGVWSLFTITGRKAQLI